MQFQFDPIKSKKVSVGTGKKVTFVLELTITNDTQRKCFFSEVKKVIMSVKFVVVYDMSNVKQSRLRFEMFTLQIKMSQVVMDNFTKTWPQSDN